MTSFLDDYFARIGYTAVPAVNLETLRTLHLQHNSAFRLKILRSFCLGKSN
jgi:N-hydroxyarylamine O-acetyltransferase